MSDPVNVQKNKLTREQKKLIYDSLSTNVIHFQEYRLDVIKPDGAVLFEYLCYNSFKQFIEERTSNGFFYHSYERIGEEYGIGKDRVKTIVAYLKKIGVVETKVSGFPKNTHYRIRFDTLATVSVLTQLFRAKADRVKEMATRYSEIAKLVNLREETTTEALEKEYALGLRWFDLLKKIFYQERASFNKTVSSEAASRKVQPSPREATLRNIEKGVYLVYHDYQGRKLTEHESNEQFRNYVNGFRLYCALYFLFNSSEVSSARDLAAYGEEDFANGLVNYASGIRDPIAYFFAEHDGGINFMMFGFIDGSQYIDFTTGYFGR